MIQKKTFLVDLFHLQILNWSLLPVIVDIHYWKTGWMDFKMAEIA